MPKVGKKHYPYTHAGRRAAKEAAKKQGLKVEYTESTYESISKLLFEAGERINDVPDIKRIRARVRGASPEAKEQGKKASNKARSEGSSRLSAYRIGLHVTANSKS
tara:strand:- start:342 stop:659 length:318 start_codon:yes stop_codon:yes gene_type:complete